MADGAGIVPEFPLLDLIWMRLHLNKKLSALLKWHIWKAPPVICFDQSH